MTGGYAIRAAVKAHVVAAGAVRTGRSAAGLEAAMHFRATPAGRDARDVVDTMTFDAQGLIVAMRAYADPAPGVRGDP